MKHFQDILPINSTIKQNFVELEPFFRLKNIDFSHAVFFDIETTGLSATYCSIYMIGFVTFQGKNCIRQIYFAETPGEEDKVLASFLDFIQNRNCLIHFNGDGFDIPFLRKKCQQYNRKCDFDTMISFDIFKQMRSFKDSMQLENAKQKSFEKFLHIDRKDVYTGKELIPIYKNYTVSPCEENLQILLQHNLDDLEGMILLVPILLYPYAFLCDITSLSYEINQYRTLHQEEKSELLITGFLPFSLPFPIRIKKNEYYLKLEKNTLHLRCLLSCGEYKHFYENYKDYYYLPMEDTAMHKSVAEFVDKAYRKKATKATCYTKATGSFAPLPDSNLEPVYKTEQKSKHFFLPIEQLEKEDSLKRYVNCILQFLKP